MNPNSSIHKRTHAHSVVYVWKAGHIDRKHLKYMVHHSDSLVGHGLSFKQSTVCRQLFQHNRVNKLHIVWTRSPATQRKPDFVSALSSGHFLRVSTFEPLHDKTNKMTCVPSKDSDQPGHPPSLIRVFAVHSIGSKGPNVSSCTQRRLW